ncbi:hypothetical protein PENSPDRAFT_227619 [Peniophora sp. CONT]|nr:hypothetical protein PENSPDRAFT_227619 [Peniophora sp. CONT]
MSLFLKAFWVLGCDALSLRNSTAYCTLSVNGKRVKKTHTMHTDSASHWVVNAHLDAEASATVTIDLYDGNTDECFASCDILARDIAQYTSTSSFHSPYILPPLNARR